MALSRVAMAALAALALAGVVRSAAAQAPHVQAMMAGQVLRGRFVQDRHLEGMTTTLHSEGSFVLVPGKGLIWRGEKPFAVDTVITPQGVLQRIDNEDAMRVPASRAPMLAHFYDMMTSVLSGDWSAVKRDFRVTEHGDAHSWTMTLMPQDKNDVLIGRIARITLRGERLVEHVEIRQTNGDWETLDFLDQAVSTVPLTPEDAALFAAADR
jgi:Outer membrane lipoprotein carrier protein LolA-like